MPPPETVLARFDGKSVTLGEFLEYLRSEEGLAPLRRFLEGVLIAERAADANLQVTDKDLQAAADAFRRDRGLFRASDFERFLAAARINPDDFESKLRRGLLKTKLMAKAIPEAEAERFFYENRLEHDRARLSRIVVREEGLAQEIAVQLREGRGFPELARKHSLIPAEAMAGGYAGEKARKELPPEAEPLVFSAKKGGLAGPIAVGQEHHLYWVHEILPAKLTPELREGIREILFERWLEAEYRKAKVEMEI